MDNQNIILLLTIISVLLTFISVILVPLFKFVFLIEKRITTLETKEQLKEKLKKENK